MIGSLVGFLLAALMTAGLVPLVRRLAFRVGAVDTPGGRRVHTQHVARLGGLAIFVSFFVSLALLATSGSGLLWAFLRQPSHIVGLFSGGLLLAVLGAVDDVRGLRALHKLGFQIVAAGIAYYAGFRIDGLHLPGIGDVATGWVSLPLTMLWIVGLVNALNLIDGLDGLAAGVAFFACVTNFVVASISGAPGVMLVSAVLGGALLGFLIFNFNPATIFLGDSGSLFLGYTLATTSLLSATIKSSTTVALLVPVLALGVPIFDTLFAMTRRLLERRPIFSADRGHIHHRLLDLGLTHRRAVLMLYAVSGVGTLSAIALAAGRDLEVGIALAILTLLVIGLVRFFGTVEQRIARRRLITRSSSGPTERLRRAIPGFVRRIAESRSVSDVARELATLAGAAGLHELEVEIGDTETGFRFVWSSPREISGPSIEATFHLPGAGRKARARFRMESEGDELAPQDHVLLQLVVDTLEPHLAEASRRNPEAETELARVGT